MKAHQLPHSPEAERAILGGILLYNAAFEQARVLSPADFFLPAHRTIWSVICGLCAKGTPVDLVILAEELTRRGERDAIGGAGYISSLTDGQPKLSSVEHYVKIIRDKATRRRLIYAAEEIAKRAQEGPESEAEILAWARERLPALAANGNDGEGPGVLLSEVEPERVEWLWRNRIPLGKVTMLDGDPGLGKSLLALDLAARLSKGQPLPGDDTGVSGGAVICTAEDGLADTVVPRLIASGADRTRIVALKYTPDREGEKTVSEIPAHIPTIQEAVSRVGAKLVVMDVLMAYLPQETHSYRDQDIRLALAPLAEMADRMKVAVVCIRHLTKTQGGNPIYRGGGSIGIIGGARAGLLVAKDPEDQSLIVLAQPKSNLGPPMPSLAYRIEANNSGVPHIVWQGESQQTAVSLLAAAAGDEEERGALADAKDFLRKELGGGRKPQKDLVRDARRIGISERTLKRAKAALGLKSGKDRFESEWHWELPTMPKSAEEGQTENLAPFPENGGNGPALSPEKSDPYSKGAKDGQHEECQEGLVPFGEGESLPLEELDYGEV